MRERRSARTPVTRFSIASVILVSFALAACGSSGNGARSTTGSTVASGSVARTASSTTSETGTKRRARAAHPGRAAKPNASRSDLTPHRPVADHRIQGHPGATVSGLANCAVADGFTVASPTPSLVRIIDTGRGIAVAQTARRGGATATSGNGVTLARRGVDVRFGRRPDRMFVGQINRCLTR